MVPSDDAMSLTAEDSGPSACCAVPVDPRIMRAFDEKASQWTDLDELPEMVDVSGRLLDLLRDAPLRRPSVLELGSGTGGLGVALLEIGASRVTGVDLSSASVEVARRRARMAGFAESAAFEVGNAAEVVVEPHDWVILDRVICCFGDVDRLIGRATELARRRIGISAPESRGWRGLVNRPMWAVESIWDLLHAGCRGYVHDLRRVEQRLAAAGFRRAGSTRVGLWYVGIYDRA